MEEGEALDRALLVSGVDGALVPSGRLLGLGPSFVDAATFDGSPDAPLATLANWRQLYLDLDRAGEGLSASPLPDLDVLHERAGEVLATGMVPLALQSLPYERLREDAFESRAVRVERDRLVDATPAAFESGHAFALAAMRSIVHADDVTFVLEPGLVFGEHPGQLEVDLGDGGGYRALAIGEPIRATYAKEGAVTLRVRASYGDEVRYATASLDVGRSVPTPDISWVGQRAGRSYGGVFAEYDARIFLGAGNTSLRRPVVVVEGFDPYWWDPVRKRTWQEIYALLDLQQPLASAIRNGGYDVVVMKLDHAADYIQRNAFALEHLLGRLKAAIPSGEEIVVIGPSMGGLVARYGLGFMEQQGIDHDVRLYVSFDAPQRGANIPLGDQHFFDFFAGDAPAASDGRRAVNSPAARQMVVYHYASFPYPDALRTTLESELNGYGYPQQGGIRNVALVNGSGRGLAQKGNSRVNFRRMAPRDKIVEYRHRNFWLDIDGDVWAVTDQAATSQIFEGRVDPFGPIGYRSRDVSVGGTRAYDGAPGGSRDTQGEIADADVDHGQIYSSFPDHAFIPTTSGLDLNTSDLYYNVQSDPSNLVWTQSGEQATAVFDAVYFPAENEVHLAVTRANAEFVARQIDPAITLDIPPPALAVSVSGPSYIPDPGSGTFSASASGGQAPYSYGWQVYPDCGPTPGPDPWPCPRGEICQVAPDGSEHREAGTKGEGASSARGPSCNQWTTIGTSATVTYAPSNLPSRNLRFRARVRDGQNTTVYSRTLYVTHGLFGLNPDAREGGAESAATARAAEVLPEALTLSPVRPNPFGAQAEFTLGVPHDAHARVALYDVLGREVALVLDAAVPAGWHRTPIDGRALAPGVYVVRAVVNGEAATARVTRVE